MIVAVYGNGDGRMTLLTEEHVLPLIRFMATQMVSCVCWL